MLGQISDRADAFLEGLETTHALRRVVSQACDSVQQLRAAMARIDAEVVAKAIKVPQLAQRQQVGHHMLCACELYRCYHILAIQIQETNTFEVY